MIGIQEFTGDLIKVEQFLNTEAVRLGWKILSVQKIRCWYLFGTDEYLVTYEKEDKQC